MKTNIFKKVGLAFLALVFGLVSIVQFLPTKTASAVSDGAKETDEDSLSSVLWYESSDSANVFCDEGAAALFKAICFKEPQTLLGTPSDPDRYVTVTMHAGENGHFEDGDPSEHTVTYFYTDVFGDTTVPVSNDPGYVFAGWSTSPEATEVDVEVGITRAAEIDGDLYAVWSNKAYVYYHIYNGVWDGPESETYAHIMMEYNAGDLFRPLDPLPRSMEHYYDFAGWSTQAYGRGDHYDATTPISEFITEVYSEWHYNASYIEDEMEVDEEYDVTSGVSVPLFKFTPTETATYEIYTDGIISGETEEELYQGIIRVQDIYDRNLKREQAVDPSEGWGDVHLYYEMQAGQTYFIRFAEAAGHFLRFNAGIRKAQLVTVTFDANHGGDAWFDGDHSKKTKELLIPIGDDIALRRIDELETTDDLSFALWVSSPNPETEDIHSYLVITEPTTVYARYNEMIVFNLDYNGGHDPFYPEVDSTPARFYPWDNFDSPIDPKMDDPTKRFSGWSVDSEATKPDDYIIEGKISAGLLDEYIQEQTLYAVYSRPVSVTFVTTGGAYMIDDPSVTTFTTSVGEGHAFNGMAAMHYHPNVKHAGWINQNNGEYIPETSQVDGRYRVYGDTVYTSVLKFELLAMGNGGFFPNGGIGGAEIKLVQVPYENYNSTFSYDEILELLGTPTSYDSSKYFIGFATDPDATEPDIIDGETLLESLPYPGEIYAIWADDEYYFDETSETTWTKGDTNGLRIVVKRRGDDSQTFDSFTGAHMDEDELEEGDGEIEEGSLILTLYPEYLETLAVGEHELTLHFSGVNPKTTISIIEPEEDSNPEIPDAPDTGSNSTIDDYAVITSFIGLAVVLSIIAFVGYRFHHRRKV